MTPFDASKVNVIRGKSLMMPQPVGDDIRTLCFMLDWFEGKLHDLLGEWRERLEGVANEGARMELEAAIGDLEDFIQSAG